MTDIDEINESLRRAVNDFGRAADAMTAAAADVVAAFREFSDAYADSGLFYRDRRATNPAPD